MVQDPCRHPEMVLSAEDDFVSRMVGEKFLCGNCHF
jgi:hypothetical protein